MVYLKSIFLTKKTLVFPIIEISLKSVIFLEILNGIILKHS